MAKFSIHELALGKFRGHPDWPVRILVVLDPKIASSNSRAFKHLVFCYGSNDTRLVLKTQFMQFEANIAEAMKFCSKGVKGAFEEFIHQPNNYFELCEGKLKTQIPILGQQTTAGSPAIIARISTTEQEIQRVMENLA